jgi:hypothetical protein
VELGDQIAVRERGQEESAEKIIKRRMADGGTVFLLQNWRGEGVGASCPEAELLHGGINLGLEPLFGGSILSGGKAMITNQESSVLEMAWLIGGLPGWGNGAVEDASDETESQKQS